MEAAALCSSCCWLWRLLLVFLLPLPASSSLGFNWGTLSSQPVPPRIVVQMLRANNISKIKLFDSNPDILSALSGSNIEVMVGVPNDLLQPFSASSATTDAWVQSNITRYMGKGGVNIK